MKRSDIPDELVIELARQWQRGEGAGAVASLIEQGVPVKLALAKVEHLTERGLLTYGVTPWQAHPRVDPPR